MAITVNHAFASAKSDGTDNTLVQPSNWNAPHVLKCDADNLIGRATAANGPAEQIPCASYSRSLLARLDGPSWLIGLGAFPSAGGTVSGAVTITAGLTVQSTINVTGSITGTNQHLTGTFQVDTTSQFGGAVNMSSGLTVGGPSALQGITATSGSFSGTLGVTGAITASGGITAPNCAKMWVRFAGGGVASQFNLGSATFVSFGNYNVSQTTAAGTGMVIISVEHGTPCIGVYQWLDSQTFNVKFFNPATGAALDPFGWSAAVFH